MKERDYDVLVYGAGPAGVAAAVAAARRGQRTLLVDDAPDVGGASVCGLLNAWHGEAESPLMPLLHRLTKRAWGRLIFEPEELSQALRQCLDAAGVELMLNAGVVKARAKGGRIKSAAFAACGGRVKLSAWSFIDASQDQALARRACKGCDGTDADTHIALLARVGGIDTRVQGVFDAEVLRQYAAQFRTEQALEEIPAYLSYPELIPCLRGGTAILSAAGEGVRVEKGASGLTAAESWCREGIYAALGFLGRNVPGYENCHLVHFASRPLRMEGPCLTRLRAESAASSETEAVEDITVLMYRDVDRPGMNVAVPLGALMCRGAANLLLASANMRADQLPLLLACGDAAGRVAAEAVLYDGDIGKLDPERLKKALRPDYD